MTKKTVRRVNGLLRTLINMPARTIGTLALILCLFGCVTGEKMSRLHPGMTKAEVVSVLGRPDGYKQIVGHEVYRYSNRLSSGWLPGLPLRCKVKQLQPETLPASLRPFISFCDCCVETKSGTIRST
jgi:SmpA / OmlA family